MEHTLRFQSEATGEIYFNLRLRGVKKADAVNLRFALLNACFEGDKPQISPNGLNGVLNQP